MSPIPVPPGELPRKAIIGGVAAALALFACVGLLHYFPLSKVELTEANSERVLSGKSDLTGGNAATYWKRDVRILETTAFESVIFTAAFILLIWSLNGRRFTKFSGAGFTIDSPAVEKAAVALGDPKVASRLPAGDSAPPALALGVSGATLPPSTALKVAGRTFDIFAPRDVPLPVINAALTRWPSGPRKPRSLGELNFGALNAGSEAPWLLGFHTGLVAVTADCHGNLTVTLVA